jgi:hypothetical protein
MLGENYSVLSFIHGALKLFRIPKPKREPEKRPAGLASADMGPAYCMASKNLELLQIPQPPTFLHHTNSGSNVLPRMRALNNVAIAILLFANDL